MNTNDRSGGGGARRRRAARNKQRNPSRGGGTKSRGDVQLKDLDSLERLRDSVEAAARELKRLREENAALAERISALETHPGTGLDQGTLLPFDEDPDVLRRKVATFIEAIDQHLKGEPENE